MRGQQALEYLVTYGWAFVIVIITIGAFAYFGILNPQQYIPERCDFGVQLQCADFILLADEEDSHPGQVHLKFFNGYGVDIEIVNLSTPSGGGTALNGTGDLETSPWNGGITVEDGTISGTVVLDLQNPDFQDPDYFLADGDKTLVPIAVTFKQAGNPDAPGHQVIGEVFASAQDAEIS